MNLTRRTSAFTLIELLVVITIIGILITIAVPNLTTALDGAKMTQTLSNARSLQQATAAMTFDSLNSSDPDALDWTSKTASSSSGQPTPAGLTEYFMALTNGSAYLSPNDLKKLLTAPGRNPQNGTLGSGNIAFNIYPVNSNSPSEQVFVATQNWSYGGQLKDVQPYGRKGFVFYTKGGGGGIKRNPKDATNTNDFPASSDTATLNYSPIK